MELLNGKRLQWALYRLERHSIDFVSEVDCEADLKKWIDRLSGTQKTKRPMFSHQPWSLILGVISSKSAHHDRAQ